MIDYKNLFAVERNMSVGRESNPPLGASIF